MKHSIIIVWALGILLLAGCGGSGGIMSPRYSYSDSHNITMTTTQMASQEQSHNKATCIGLLVFASCNTTQSNVQTAPRGAAPVVNQPTATPTLADVVHYFLVAAGSCALFVLLLTGLRRIFGFGDEYEA